MSAAGRELLMKAVVFNRHGDSGVMEMSEVPVPEVPDGWVLVRVNGSSINHLDFTVRSGSAGIPVHFPHIGGCDAAGTVAALGRGATGYREGEAVVVNPGIGCGNCPACRMGEDPLCEDFRILGEHMNGSFAEFVSVPARNLKRMPQGFSLVKAAASPLVYLTAWHALVGRAGIRFGERVLVTGGSGGVSTAAIQIAKLFDANVVATTRKEEKADALRRIGADDVIVTTGEGWGKNYLDRAGINGFDIVIDSVGSALWKDSIRSLSKGGRFLNYGRTSGGHVSTDLSFIFWKQLQIIGSTMGNPDEFDTVMNLIFNRRLDPVVDRVFSLREAGLAQDYVESAGQIGKVVLLVGEDSH